MKYYLSTDTLIIEIGKFIYSYTDFDIIETFKDFFIEHYLYDYFDINKYDFFDIDKTEEFIFNHFITGMNIRFNLNEINQYKAYEKFLKNVKAKKVDLKGVRNFINNLYNSWRDSAKQKAEGERMCNLAQENDVICSFFDTCNKIIYSSNCNGEQTNYLQQGYSVFIACKQKGLTLYELEEFAKALEENKLLYKDIQLEYSNTFYIWLINYLLNKYMNSDNSFYEVICDFKEYNFSSNR